MTEFAWDTALNDEPNPQSDAEEMAPESALEAAPEQFEDRPIVALSANDFSALEERVLRAVEVVRRERHARAAAEDRVAALEERLREQSPVVEQLEKEISILRAERDHVRERVERLLAQLDALEL